MAELNLMNYAYYVMESLKKNVTLGGIVKSLDETKYYDRTKILYVNKISVKIKEPSNIEGMIIKFNLGDHSRVQEQHLLPGEEVEILARDFEVTSNYKKDKKEYKVGKVIGLSPKCIRDNEDLRHGLAYVRKSF